MQSKKLLKSLTAGRGAILSPHIDAYQAKGNFPPYWNIEIRNLRKEDRGFHPSSDCYTPAKTLYLQKQDLLIREKISPTLRRTFDIGHMIHGYLQNILVDMKFVHQDNVELHLEQVITTNLGQCLGVGTADLVDVQIPGHGSWLVDIKTMRKTEFEQGASDETLAKWRAQVSCYMDWTNSSKALILAISKDSPHIFREYQMQKDQTLLDEIYDRWTYTQYCLDNNVEPI